MKCPLCDLDFDKFPSLEEAFVIHFVIDHAAQWEDKCPVCKGGPFSVLSLIEHVKESCGMKALASHVALEIMGGVYEED